MYIPSRIPHPSFANTQALDRLPMPTIEEMMNLGVAIDVDYFASLAEEMRDMMKDLEAKVRRRIPADKLAEFLGGDDVDDEWEDDSSSTGLSRFKITSPEQIAWFLFDILGLGKGKQLVTTPDGSRISTGKKQLEVLKHEHEAVQEILSFREVHKLYTTYVLKLPRISKFHPRGRCCPVCGRSHNRSSNRVHSTIVTTRTETGRLAGRRPNLMNIAGRTPLGKRVRKGFIPSYGKKMVGSDYSQIELRIIASESNDPFMSQCFHQRRDVHAESTLKAMGLHGKAEYVKDPANPEEKILRSLVPNFNLPSMEEFGVMRTGMKNANFGIVYGITWKGLQATLALIGIYWTKEQTYSFIEDTWHKVFTEIRRYMREQEYRVRKYGFVWDPMGSIRPIPNIRSAVKRIVAEAVRQAGNMPVQSFGAAFLKIAMYTLRAVYEKFRDEGYEVDFLMPVHDEIVSECDAEIAEDLRKATVQVMADVNEYTQLLVPVVAEGKVMDYWTK